MKRDDEQGLEEWELSESPQKVYVKQKPSYAIQHSDIEDMKEKFSKLLLGEDVTGGTKGITTALALSNAITNLSGMLLFVCFHNYSKVLFRTLNIRNQLLVMSAECFESISPYLFIETTKQPYQSKITLNS